MTPRDPRESHWTNLGPDLEGVLADSRKYQQTNTSAGPLIVLAFRKSSGGVCNVKTQSRQAGLSPASLRMALSKSLASFDGILLLDTHTM